MASENGVPPGFQDMLASGLVEALIGRRARRFFMGAEIGGNNDGLSRMWFSNI